MKIAFLFVILTFLSFFLTKTIQVIARKKKIVDIPNYRSSHDSPTPRGGGIAIAIIWYSIIALLYIANLLEENLFFALASGIIISVVSLVDDIKNVTPYIRIAAQILSVGTALFFLGGIQHIDLGFVVFSVPWYLNIVAIFIWVWFINLFNFLDGIDGYLGMEGVFIFLALYFFTDNYIVLLLVPLILGFLLLNWPKATIFSGDTGSTLIGFSVMAFAVYFQNSGEVSIIVPLILTGLFWMDATVTLIRRLINKENPVTAHNKHAYQRLVRGGFSHLQVVLTGIFINIILLSIALFFYLWYPRYLLAGLLLQIVVSYGFIRYADRKKKFKYTI